MNYSIQIQFWTIGITTLIKDHNLDVKQSLAKHCGRV